ncbi:class I SAM-dependent methyltransferase [Halioglobus maricola]|uniref:Class I SAM-dependent methyltransferase n=1 Tax=Halioglobus maricola TaxID=2601894 RepID=A0A5P9NIF0_9GAMM|nr:class I SAM-dependent methyltransferase [Halioglobus maricola]QFU74768.1 class I SAM-dependent methyltransferase [Halioglobus maricola]
MRPPVRQFVELCEQTLPLEGTIYEFGAYQVTGDQGEDLRTLFPGCEYYGADMREGPGVDVVLNLHDIDLPDASAKTVVCMDTLEHVEYPRKAMDEIHRILAPGGVAIISSVFDFPIHGYPNDYWRFTPEGFRSLLKAFSHPLVYSFGKSEESPQTITGVGFKDFAPDTQAFEQKAEQWEKWCSSIARQMHSDSV